MFALALTAASLVVLGMYWFKRSQPAVSDW